MSLQDVIRFVLPKQEHFYDYLEKQAKVAHGAANALTKFTDSGQTAEQVRAAVQECEREGDAMVHAMEEALAKTFVTPIDREDLHGLSAELDIVLDLTNSAIRECTMFGVETATEPMKRLVKILVQCTQRIDALMPKLRRHEYNDIVTSTRELRRMDQEADGVYGEAITTMYKNTTVGWKELFREKIVLEDLDYAIEQCDSIADHLANLAIKNG
jgi:uncharacterized protein Yka (UPF0111/DUF47 family)